jgi:hypothetical protein
MNRMNEWMIQMFQMFQMFCQESGWELPRTLSFE